MKSLFPIFATVCSALVTSCVQDNLTDIGQGFISEHLEAPWHNKTDNTRFSCHSSSDRFFFSFEVEDSSMVLFNGTDTPDSIASAGKRIVDYEDRVEVYFSPGQSLTEDYYCAEIDAAGRIMDYKAGYYRKLDFSWHFNTLKAEAMLTPWGYRVSGSVSRDELLGLGIDLNNGFWMGVYRADCLNNGDFEWYSLVVPDEVKEADFHAPGVLFGCKATPKKELRGVVVYPDDISSLGLSEWEKRIDLSGIGVIGLHAATSNDPIDTLESFIRSDIGKGFLELCRRKGVDVEYELHALEYLLPRDLFELHPDYFRVDENGERCKEYNMCFSSQAAVEAMRPQLEKLLEWVKPTTHRYYFWADDKQGKFCNCEKCAAFSPSEQILMYENRLLAMLREYDPEATLAHLAYQQTESVPMALRADIGIFLEFAPIKRDYDFPLSDEQTASLRGNLMAFPIFSQHILEYWLDESMFCKWKKNNPVPLPFKKEQAMRDIALYRELGAADFTCFATWLNARYCSQFGNTDSVFESYGASF